MNNLKFACSLVILKKNSRIFYTISRDKNKEVYLFYYYIFSQKDIMDIFIFIFVILRLSLWVLHFLKVIL